MWYYSLVPQLGSKQTPSVHYGLSALRMLALIACVVLIVKIDEKTTARRHNLNNAFSNLMFFILWKHY